MKQFIFFLRLQHPLAQKLGKSELINFDLVGCTICYLIWGLSMSPD